MNVSAASLSPIAEKDGEFLDVSRSRLEDLEREIRHLSATIMADSVLVRRDAVKNRHVRQTFVLLTACFILSVCALAGYFCFLLARPFLASIAFAFITSLLLARPRDALLAFVLRVDRSVNPVRAAASVAVAAALLLGLAPLSPGSRWVVGAGSLVAVYAVFMGRRELVACLLCLGLLVLFTFPAYYTLRACVEESVKLPSALHRLLDDNPGLVALAKDWRGSDLFRKGEEFLASWGWTMPDDETAKAQMRRVGDLAASHLASFFANVFSFFFQSFSEWFFMCSVYFGLVFAFLVHREALAGELRRLSPWSSSDYDLLAQSVQSSVVRTFLSSLTVGILHALATLLTFLAAGQNDILFLAAFASGLLSLVPVLSSWLVWVPLAISLYVQGFTLGAAFTALVHLFTGFAIEPAVTRRISGGNPFVVGLSIAFGVYSFGPLGALFSPLAVGLTLTLIELYQVYISEFEENGAQQMQHHQPNKDALSHVESWFHDTQHQNDTTVVFKDQSKIFKKRK
jgi:predicted PurR-regulated permease PerM